MQIQENPVKKEGPLLTISVSESCLIFASNFLISFAARTLVASTPILGRIEFAVSSWGCKELILLFKLKSISYLVAYF